jgi:hypothetical protein
VLLSPLLSVLVAARQRRQPQLRAPGVTVVSAPLRLTYGRCLLVHIPTLALRRTVNGTHHYWKCFLILRLSDQRRHPSTPQANPNSVSKIAGGPKTKISSKPMPPSDISFTAP